MMHEKVIQVRDLGKTYKIWKSPSYRLKSILLHGVKTVFPFLDNWCCKMQGGCYSNFTALAPLSFSVKKGETLGILGKNGSGKSTLLQLLAGILTPTSGSVRVQGRVAALLELGSGFNPEFTGRENVFHNASILGLSDKEITSRYEQIVAFADIGDFIDRPVRTYSSGMVVRLAFAVVAHIDPNVLIIDEALAVGDAPFQAKCYQKFREARESGCTILFVTHDIGAIVSMCDRAILLSGGCLLGDGAPKLMADMYRRTFTSGGSSSANPTISREPTRCTLKRRKETEEYGSGGVYIAEVEINVKASDDGTVRVLAEEILELRLKLVASTSVANPIAAFGVRDLLGNDLIGTNTWYEESDIGPLVKGEGVKVVFRFNLGLKAGLYTLSLACTELRGEGLHVYHRLYDYALLQVNTERRFAGAFDVRPKVHISKTPN